MNSVQLNHQFEILPTGTFFHILLKLYDTSLEIHSVQSLKWLQYVNLEIWYCPNRGYLHICIELTQVEHKKIFGQFNTEVQVQIYANVITHSTTPGRLQERITVKSQENSLHRLA